MMVRILLISLISCLIFSCGNTNKFNKQKFTNLKHHKTSSSQEDIISSTDSESNLLFSDEKPLDIIEEEDLSINENSTQDAENPEDIHYSNDPIQPFKVCDSLNQIKEEPSKSAREHSKKSDKKGWFWLVLGIIGILIFGVALALGNVYPLIVGVFMALGLVGLILTFWGFYKFAKLREKSIENKKDHPTNWIKASQWMLIFALPFFLLMLINPFLVGVPLMIFAFALCMYIFGRILRWKRNKKLADQYTRRKRIANFWLILGLWVGGFWLMLAAAFPILIPLLI